MLKLYRSEYRIENQADYKVLKFFFNFGSYFGGTSLKYKKSNGFYYLNFAVVLLFYVLYLYRFCIISLTPSEPLFKFVTIVWRVCLVLIATYFVFWPHCFYHNEFEQIYSKLEDLEDILRALKFDQKNGVKKLKIRIFLVVLVWVFAHLIGSSVVTFLTQPIEVLFFTVPNIIFIILLFMNIFLISIVLERRMNYATKIVKKCSQYKDLERNDLPLIKNVLKLNQEIIELYNKLFGYPISFFLTASLLQLLRYVFMTIYFNKDESDNALSAFEMVISWGMTITIIIHCDYLEKRGKLFYAKCFKLHDNTKTYDINNEYLLLAETAKKLVPNIIVPLYGLINRQTFNVLFSAFVDVLVILIQFQMSM